MEGADRLRRIPTEALQSHLHVVHRSDDARLQAQVGALAIRRDLHVETEPFE